MKFLEKTFYIIGDKNKTIFFLVLLMSLIALILEMLSLSLIIPLLTTLQSVPNENLKILYLINNINFLSLDTVDFILFLIFVVFFFKLIYFTFFIFIKNSFSYKLLKEICDKLYNNYLRQDYKFFLQRNSSELVRNISVQVEVFIDQGIRACIDLFTETIIVVGVLTVLLFYNFNLTISIVFFLILFLLIFNLLTKKKSKYFANLKIHAVNKLIQLVNEAVYGNILIKVLKSENYFSDLFKKYSAQIKNSSSYYETYFELPKYFLEFVAVIILIIVFTLISFLKIDTNPITLLSLYAAAGFKLMPTLNRIITCVHKLRFGKQTLNILYEELNKSLSISQLQKNNDELKLKNFNKTILLREISFSFKDDKEKNKKIFEDLNLEIKKGQTIGITGESGSGKTTLLNLILGFLKPDYGNIFYDNIDITNKKINLKNLVGYVSQNTFLLDASIKNNVAFAESESQINETLVKKSLADAQLEKFIETLPNGINTLIGENGTRLSGGQKQRLSIARALYFNPQILILDEATNALDEQNEEKFFEVINQYKSNKTIIIVSHGKNALKFTDSIYVIRNNKLTKM